MPIQSTSTQLVRCSICMNVFHDGELGGCYGCGERICDDCPHFACSCIDDEPTMREPRLRLRQYAIELAVLRNQKVLFGAAKPTVEQEARLLLLTGIVASLRTEVNRMDEEKHGDIYTEEDNVSLEDSQRLFIPRR